MRSNAMMKHDKRIARDWNAGIGMEELAKRYKITKQQVALALYREALGFGATYDSSPKRLKKLLEK